MNNESEVIAMLRYAAQNTGKGKDAFISDDILLDLVSEYDTLRSRLAVQETIMRRAAAVCGSEEDWERIDELVALLHSQYTQERESANQYAQMNYGKLNNIIHELEFLVNKYSFDAKTNTPDYILAEYLYECLMNYVEVTWKNDIHRKASDENTNDNN